MATTSVASTTTSTTLLNPGSRTGFVIENSDANRLYVLLGDGTASASNYSFSLAQNENAMIAGHQGRVVGVWAAAGAGRAFLSDLRLGR